MKDKTDLSSLGAWLNSWTQPSGAIHGFHNHPIWGSNPYRIGDFFSGHSTFAAPLMVALVRLLEMRDDERGRALLRRLVTFQRTSLQSDGNYRFIGFQVGEFAKRGLIHSAIPNVAMALAAERGRCFLGDEEASLAMEQVGRSLALLDEIHPNTGGPGVCNQEYARTWARMLYAGALNDVEQLERAKKELHALVDAFHVSGSPDGDCIGCLRSRSDEMETLEPAEYYGLMMLPLLLGHRLFQENRFLEQAAGIARHITRSSWMDDAGCRRLHRLWYRRNGRYERIRSPMCIAGSGLTALGVHQVDRVSPDAELSSFVADIRATYAHYQHPAGYLLSATGWHSELDVVPSSAWQTHDLLFLAETQPSLPPDFWDAFFAPPPPSILPGGQCLYVERGPHWAILDYHTNSTYRIMGRKDRDWFGRDLPSWLPQENALPDEMKFPDLPLFWKTDDAFVPVHSLAEDWRIASWA